MAIIRREHSVMIVNKFKSFYFFRIYMLKGPERKLHVSACDFLYQLRLLDNV